MRKKLILLLSLLFVLPLAGCAGGGNSGGGGFDIVAFLYKPYIAIPLALLIAYWMLKRNK